MLLCISLIPTVDVGPFLDLPVNNSCRHNKNTTKSVKKQTKSSEMFSLNTNSLGNKVKLIPPRGWEIPL